METAGKLGGNSKKQFSGLQKCKETARRSILRSRKMQGNKGKTQKSILRPRKMQGNNGETQKIHY